MLFASKLPAQLTQEDVNGFCKGYNYPVARSFLRTYVRSFLKDKDLEIPKFRGRRKYRLPKALDTNEISELLKGIENTRDRLMVRLMFEGGLRVSEMLSLMPRNFDFNHNKIRLIGKGRKEGIVDFLDDTKILLLDYIETNKIKPDEKIFTISRKQVWRLLRDHGFRILDRNLTPHMLRHSCATFLRRSGMGLLALQKYLRHERLETVKIYAEVSDKEVHDEWKKSFEKLKRNS